MKPTEKRFENKLIEALRDAGFFCIHPNIMNQDGFPDLIANTGDYLALIEVKVIESLGDHIHGYFQPTQAPFYHQYLKSGGGGLWVAFDCQGDGYLVKILPGMVKEWRNMTWFDFYSFGVSTYTGKPWELASGLWHYLRGHQWQD